MENLQVTGSFKARGAVNKLLSLSVEQRRKGVVSASTGNHGAAVAYSAQKLDVSCSIFVPKDMYSMISGYENVYPTYGFSSSFIVKPYRSHKLNFEYSYFKSIDHQLDDSFFSTVFFSYMINREFLFFLTELELFVSKDFFKISEKFLFEENTIYGGSLSISLYKGFSIIGTFKNTFYDIRFRFITYFFKYISCFIIKFS